MEDQPGQVPRGVRAVGESRRTKIVATAGPACESEEVVRALVTAGVDVFRLNLSHADHAWHGEMVRKIRRASDDLQRPVAILVDLRGPRIRIGRLEDGPRHLRRGDEIFLAHRDASTAEEPLPVSYPDFARDVRPGERVLIADGLIELLVREVHGESVRCEVVFGGMLASYKGINLPSSRVSAPSLSDKDVHDLAFAVEQEADYVALSFVRDRADLRAAREAMGEARRRMRLVAKIERPEALTHLDAILEEADGVMVARGDLGVEMGVDNIPILQKRIIRRAVERGVPVITATQMMESMVENPRPTRAEATDVANAILDGTDALMLSAETAAGKYPREVIAAMERIAARAEEAWFDESVSPPRVASYCHTSLALQIVEATAGAACVAAHEVGAKAIAAFTDSGRTARILSARRQRTPIFAFTRIPETYRRMALFWGVTPRLVHGARNVEDMVGTASAALRASGHVGEGDRVVLVSGATNVSAATNSIRIFTVGTERDT